MGSWLGSDKSDVDTEDIQVIVHDDQLNKFKHMLSPTDRVFGRKDYGLPIVINGQNY